MFKAYGKPALINMFYYYCLLCHIHIYSFHFSVTLMKSDFMEYEDQNNLIIYLRSS